MIGLTLVVGMGVFAASLKASFGSILDDATKADLYVSSASSQGSGFSPDVAAVVSHVPGVATASPTSWGEARFNGEGASYSSIDPATVDKVLDLDISSGSAASLGTDGVLVATDVAKANSWKVGSVVPVEFAATGKKSLVVRGTFSGTGYLDGKYLISLAAHEANEPDRLDSGVLVRVAPGADNGTVKAAIASALTDHQDAKVLTRKEYTQEVAGLVDQLLTFVSVMLLLSVLIALLGIVNTLALSVYERTRELGLLRAIGMTDRQVRAMVRWESVIISLIGAGVGAALGVGLGAALAQSLKGDGITQVAVPSGRIALYVLAAAVAGVLAAVWPARSAARVDVLRAVVAD
jgi:putative ABC transport system permease protein